MRHKLRIAIREQLALLVTFAVLLALAVVSIPTWIFVNNFVVGVESDSLALTASLKATRIASEIELVQTTCGTIVTRILIQQALTSFYQGNTSSSNWIETETDMQSALGSGGGNLFQARIYSCNTTGSASGLFNVTGLTTPSIKLPYTNADGSAVYLGDQEGGFPPSLYPNITYVDTGMASTSGPAFSAYPFPGIQLTQDDGLLLGPLVVNESYAIMSLTVPIRSNNGLGFILGYMTIVASAVPIIEVVTSKEGMGTSGVVLLIGPASASNRFNTSQPPSNATYEPDDPDAFGATSVHFALPPQAAASGQSSRHALRSWVSGNYSRPFQLKDYKAAFHVLSTRNAAINNASASLWAYNEQGSSVSVGMARPQNSIMDWAVIVEQARWEATAPINTLRTILLGCTFGTAGLILLLVFPCAHWSVMPIRRLKDATEKSMAPPGYQDELERFDLCDEDGLTSGTTSKRSVKGFLAWMQRKIRRRRRGFVYHGDGDSTRRVFKIPGKVESHKHVITDELTELTGVFNEMSDELHKQYTSLNQRVQDRTRELEISKKAAEAANESKTLFIANISHELKTPLNGIMGMCAVCMEEDDIFRIKQSLKTLYKSGDLLLHLLEDLLSFSKNQIGQQVSLEEREFRLSDIRSQILSIFNKQVNEGKITLSADFVGIGPADDDCENLEKAVLDRRLPAVGPQGMGRLKDMCLWGDQHRILQVMINLVSNSLKFTPPGGKVMVRIRCLGEVDSGDESRSSSFSKSSSRPGRNRHRYGSGSQYSASSKGASSSIVQSQVQKGTALSINPADPKSTLHDINMERPATPPPPNAKTYLFEFEVEDTGPGIPESMQQRVFEPFVQGDLGLSRKFGGTGLGLSICSQLATLMGGNVTLRSTVGAGTTFIMQIPLKYTKDKSVLLNSKTYAHSLTAGIRPSSTASSSLHGSRPPSVTPSMEPEHQRRDSGAMPEKQASEAAQAAASAAAAADLDKRPRLVGLSQPFFATVKPTTPQTEAEKMALIEQAVAKKGSEGKLRVLVADDNNTNIEVVSRMLKLESVYDVTIAKDGQEAYELVKANFERDERFDVIFMDIQMPNLDGLQSTRLIRKMGYKAPIVALTAFSDASNVKDCMDSGMNEFLAKPIRRPALKQVLQKFATIIEESETASILTRKTTPEKSTPEIGQEKGDAMVSAMELPSTREEPHSNGVAPPGKP